MNIVTKAWCGHDVSYDVTELDSDMESVIKVRMAMGPCLAPDCCKRFEIECRKRLRARNIKLFQK